MIKFKCGQFINLSNVLFYRVLKKEKRIEFVYNVKSKGYGEDYRLVVSLPATEDELDVDSTKV